MADINQIKTEEDFLSQINENQNIIHKVCKIYCYSKEEHEDLFQEITIQLWKSYKAFKGDAKFSTWMYRVALNTAISHLRKSSKKPKGMSISESQYQIADQQEEDTYEEQRTALYKAIEHLSQVEKAIIMLHLEKKTAEEIGVIIGITANYVNVKVNRIKNKLRKKLNV